MEGLARTLGRRERKLTVAGFEYTLAAPRLSDWLALELELAGTLPDPIESAAKAARYVPEGQQEAFWAAAYKSARDARKVDLANLDQLPTMLGIASQAFVSLRRNHPEETQSLDLALQWLDEAQAEHGMEELAAIFQSLLSSATAAEGEAKNAEAGPSTGPA